MLNISKYKTIGIVFMCGKQPPGGDTSTSHIYPGRVCVYVYKNSASLFLFDIFTFSTASVTAWLKLCVLFLPVLVLHKCVINLCYCLPRFCLNTPDQTDMPTKGLEAKFKAITLIENFTDFDIQPLQPRYCCLLFANIKLFFKLFFPEGLVCIRLTS